MLPFPVKNYLFEIFTRATTPGSFLIAHICALVMPCIYGWSSLDGKSLLLIDSGLLYRSIFWDANWRASLASFSSIQYQKHYANTIGTLSIFKENSFHKPGHGANNAMFWWNENLTKRPFMFQDKNENGDVNRSLVSFWNILSSIE